MSEFIYCPWCGSDDIDSTDYEIEDGVIDEDGRVCNDCGWEGDAGELVSKSE